MDDADGWFVSRVGFVEVYRALSLAGGRAAARGFEREWPAFGVIALDQSLVEHASQLAVERGLRSLDAVHLASALLLPRDDVVVATWDRRLHAAGLAEGVELLPGSLD
jgi:predicted nucleic acid-binding protein